MARKVSCSACSMAKGNRAPTAHYTTARAERPMELIHIDTAGPFPASLGGSRYAIMFVDSASRLQHPYGTRDKRAAAILAVVKRLIADMGVPRSFRVWQRSRIHEPFICGILQQPRYLTRVHGAVYDSTKRSRGEHTLESFQGRTCGTSGGLEHLPGLPLGRSHVTQLPNGLADN